MERDRVPCAVRVVSSSDDRPGRAKRSRDGREGEGHEDPLRARHEFQVARLLERFQDGERVGTLEVVSFHDLFEDGGNGVFQEMVEDVLPHVSRKRITGGSRHKVAFVRDGAEEGDKLAWLCRTGPGATSHFVASTKYPRAPGRFDTRVHPPARTFSVSRSGPWNA